MSCFCYYNAHPKGLIVPDCVKRAISVASKMDYKEVSKALNRYKKVTGADTFNSNRNEEKFMVNVLNAIQESYPAVKGQPRMNGERFALSHPKGRYVLQMAGHLTACVDGIIYDTWNCTDRCVYKSWRIDL